MENKKQSIPKHIDIPKTLLEGEEFRSFGYQYTIMYIARMHSLTEFLLAKIVNLRGQVFSNYEAAETVEAYVVKIICDWEWYVEKMLCECLKNDTSKLAQHHGVTLPKTITTGECVGYLNGVGFFDMKSVGQLKGISKKILVPTHNPFVKINNEAKKHIDEFYIFRNYVAHKSNAAKRSLMALYRKKGRNEFVEVGDFLMEQEQEGANTINLQEYGSTFWLAAMNIIGFLYPTIFKWIMQDEKMYNDKCHFRMMALMSLAQNPPK